MKSENLGSARWIAGAVILCLCWAPAFADFVSGTSTATQITDPGPHYLWWRYDIEITWSNGTGEGLSHWDLILKTGCALSDHLIEFDDPAGVSSPPDDTEWTGYFVPGGDGSIPGNDPVVKYNDPTFEPEPAGSGTFSFYANIVPEDAPEPNLFLVTKAGETITFGNLSGDIPSCTVIPEPASVGLLLIGLPWVLRRRRSRKPKSAEGGLLKRRRRSPRKSR